LLNSFGGSIARKLTNARGSLTREARTWFRMGGADQAPGEMSDNDAEALRV